MLFDSWPSSGIQHWLHWLSRAGMFVIIWRSHGLASLVPSFFETVIPNWSLVAHTRSETASVEAQWVLLSGGFCSRAVNWVVLPTLLVGLYIHNGAPSRMLSIRIGIFVCFRGPSLRHTGSRGDFITHYSVGCICHLHSRVSGWVPSWHSMWSSPKMQALLPR